MLYNEGVNKMFQVFLFRRSVSRQLFFVLEQSFRKSGYVNLCTPCSDRQGYHPCSIMLSSVDISTISRISIWCAAFPSAFSIISLNTIGCTAGNDK